jgi:adenine-specific DNA methylase
VAGWSTLVNALKQSKFVIIEAWPLETEMQAGKVKEGKSTLASSIFLIARKRVSESGIGNYTTVRAELENIVRERVRTLWQEGITGADLIIACVGAGLKAFTQYGRVELPNGDEVSPERFLTEVEGVVQETILEFLFGSKSKVSTVDAPTRFYILWRYAYGRGEIDAGEAIVFSYPLGVELDGSKGLSSGRIALLEKKGKKYCLKDYTEREKEAAKEHFIKWYKKQTEQQLQLRIPRYANRIGVEVKDFRVLDLGNRWASCGKKGTLNFSWRTVMAPIQVFDYILVHEMAHMIERGHTKNFWRIVSRVISDYEEYKTWLQVHGVELGI